MPATVTDKLKKLSKRWTSQIGAGGVGDASTTTVPLSSVTNLPTDTAVIATIDRVDANGVSTPSLEEAVIGVVSGTNLINCVRGAEGTSQAHNAGAVVEILVTAKGYNDIIDAFLVGHSQLGVHTLDTDGTLAANLDTVMASQKAVKTYADTKLLTTNKAAGTDITTGTDDVKYTTSKAITDSLAIPKVTAGGKYKIQTGWGFATGGGVNKYADKAVTFSPNFDAAPVVTIAAIGYKAGSDPSSQTDVTGSLGGDTWCGTANQPSTTGFSAQVISSVAIGATTRVLFTWIAIGT